MRKVSSVGPDHAPDTVVASLIPAVLELELKECNARERLTRSWSGKKWGTARAVSDARNEERQPTAKVALYDFAAFALSHQKVRSLYYGFAYTLRLY